MLIMRKKAGHLVGQKAEVLHTAPQSWSFEVPKDPQYFGGNGVPGGLEQGLEQGCGQGHRLQVLAAKSSLVINIKWFFLISEQAN
jgi:hypothetical protein